MDLNETNILGKLVNMTKMISDDDKNLDNVEKYIESKLFNTEGESKYFLIENPYINTRETVKSSESGGVIFIIEFILLWVLI